MREHEFTIDLPASAPRLWALFQRYDLWKEYAPAVLDVEIVWPGDAGGNGLLRKVIYPLPFGRRGESFELVKNVRPGEGYDYVMLRSGLSGSVALEPQGKDTLLTLRHSNLPDDDMGRQHEEGWKYITGALADRFASRGR